MAILPLWNPILLSGITIRVLVDGTMFIKIGTNTTINWHTSILLQHIIFTRWRKRLNTILWNVKKQYIFFLQQVNWTGVRNIINRSYKLWNQMSVWTVTKGELILKLVGNDTRLCFTSSHGLQPVLKNST